MVVATGFALFSLGLVRTCLRPTVWRFAALGLGLAALGAGPSSYQVLVVAVAAVAARAGTLASQRAAWAAVFLVAAAVPLGAWAVRTACATATRRIARSGTINVPFYPAFLRGELDPGNGPASARLARLIEREILVEPAYRRYGVDARTFMHSGTNYETVHLLGLHDRVFGLDSDYELLHDAAREVPGGVRIRGVDLGAAWRNVRSWLGPLPPFEHRTKPDRWPEPPPTIEVDGKPMPNPAALPPSTDAIPFGFLQCASDEIARCIVRRSGRRLRRSAARALATSEVTDEVARWDEGLGARYAERLDRRPARHAPSTCCPARGCGSWWEPSRWPCGGHATRGGRGRPRLRWRSSCSPCTRSAADPIRSTRFPCCRRSSRPRSRH